NNATKNITSSPLHSSYASSPFDNLLLPIVPTTNVKVMNTVSSITRSCDFNGKKFTIVSFLELEPE
ncbi:unnamed protein product, partial [Rotaria sp. Silwood1]